MEAVSASMQHTQATVRLLSKMQYNIFCFGKKAIQAVCGLILIFIGLSGRGAVATVLCLFAGCWLCMNTDVPAKVRADKVIRSMKGYFPFTTYIFDENAFTLIAGDSSESIPYSSLFHLVEDGAYLYLYISRFAAYMVDKSTVQPDRIDTLLHSVAHGSGLKWTRPASFLTFSLRTLLAGRRRR